MILWLKRTERYRVTKNPYLAGIITGVIVAMISCCNATGILP